MGQGGDGPTAVHPLHEPSSVDPGRWVGLHRRSGVVFVCSPHPQHTLLRQRGSACRAAGCVEQLIQLLYTLHMRPSPPVLASGPVSAAVLVWLASRLSEGSADANREISAHSKDLARDTGLDVWRLDGDCLEQDSVHQHRQFFPPPTQSLRHSQRILVWWSGILVSRSGEWLALTMLIKC